MTAFLLFWLLTQSVTALVVWIFTIGLGRPEQLALPSRVIVIVPVKGHHVEFDYFLKHLFAQDYPTYRVVFAVEAADDPAVAAIEAWRSKFPERFSLVVAGLAQDEGQKVANLRAGLTRVKPDDDVIVFADADIRPSPDWLVRLVAPLTRGEADIVSGFAWLVVNDRALSTFVLASMAAMMITAPRLAVFNAAWGGSIAMRNETLKVLDLANAWRGKVCDDIPLTAMAQKAGLRIAAPREVLPKLFVSTRGFGEVTDDAVRWLIFFKLYMPETYYLVMFGLSFAAAGWIAALLGTLALQPVAIAVLVAAFALAVLRTTARALIAARLWGRLGIQENRRFFMLDPLLTPIAVVLNAAYCWIALCRRRMTWAGITYEITGQAQIKVLSRRPTQ
jgi:ceramide glucosyltransferase